MHRTRHGLLLHDEIDGITTPDREPARGWYVSRDVRYANGGFKRVMHLKPIAGAGQQLFRDLQSPIGAQLGVGVGDPAALTGTAAGMLWPAALTQIFANQLKVGQQINLKATGVMSTPASAATTMTINPMWGTGTGGTTLGISNTSLTALVSRTNDPWFLDSLWTVRKIGPAASSMELVGGGIFSCPAIGANANSAGVLNFGGTDVTTLDSTTVGGIVMTTTLGGSASWAMTTRTLAFEISG